MSLQIMEALKTLHEAGYCHWDLKLDNICFDGEKYHLIDFAYSRKIRHSKNKKLSHFTGNQVFASINKFALTQSV